MNDLEALGERIAVLSAQSTPPPISSW